MEFWKWLTTPSKAKQIKRRAEELELITRQKCAEVKSTDKTGYLLELGAIDQMAINTLMKEFGLTNDEAETVIQAAKTRLLVKKLYG